MKQNVLLSLDTRIKAVEILLNDFDVRGSQNEYSVRVVKEEVALLTRVANEF